MRATLLACFALLASPAAAQPSAFDEAPAVPRGGKVPYNGPQTGGKPPPLPSGTSPFAPSPFATSPFASGPFANGPTLDPGGLPSGQPSASGTGFVVAVGRIMTNNHVVAECGRMVARNAQGKRVNARVLGVDRRRDLAVLAVPPDLGPALAFRADPPVRRGETVVTYGFPLYGLLSSGPTLTTGDISALSGIRDNPTNFQISAAVNPGNSGGPLLDDHGNVIGVIVSKLNAMKTAEVTGGDIPQNVNFAVKGTEALAFLQSQGIDARTAPSTAAPKEPADIGDIANPSTVFLECFR